MGGCSVRLFSRMRRVAEVGKAKPYFIENGGFLATTAS